MIDPLVSSLFFLFLSAKYIQVSCQVKLWVRKRDSPTFHHKIHAVYKCSLDVYLMRHTSYSLPPTVDMWSRGGHLQSRTVISNDDVCEPVKHRRANSCCWRVIPLCTFFFSFSLLVHDDYQSCSQVIIESLLWLHFKSTKSLLRKLMKNSMQNKEWAQEP